MNNAKRKNLRNCLSAPVIFAFTLIEMLVVIAIISIIAAMLAPSLRQAIGMSRSIGCINNTKQCGLALTQYAEDHTGLLPLYSGISNDGRNLCPSEPPWAGILLYEGYLQGTMTTIGGQTFAETPIIHCPDYPTPTATKASQFTFLTYGMPHFASDTDYTSNVEGKKDLLGDFVIKFPGAKPNKNIFYRRSAMRTPSGTILISDSGTAVDYSVESVAGRGMWRYVPSKFNQSAAFRLQHMSNGNALFVDNHAKSLSVTEALDCPTRIRAFLDMDGNQLPVF